MISFILALLCTVWTLTTVSFVQRIIIPWISARIDDARWRRMHPNMPSWRREPQ